MKNAIELASTTKNSARQTDPITYRGFLLFEISVPVTSDTPAASCKSIHEATGRCQPSGSFNFILQIFFSESFFHNKISQVKSVKRKRDSNINGIFLSVKSKSYTQIRHRSRRE